MVGEYNRKISMKKALRKKKISDSWYPGDAPYYDNLHQYSKNKIHCSCPMCSTKTRNKGKRRKSWNYDRSINYKPSELKQHISMNQAEEIFVEDKE